MVRAGLRVEVLGLGRAQDGPAGASVRTWDRGGLVTRALRAATLPWRARGRVLVALDPDVAATSLVVCRLRGRRLVADVHEDYAALLRDRPWARGAAGAVGRVVVAAATRAAARADLTVVADEHVPPVEGRCRRRLVVRNVPDLRHVRGGDPTDSGPRDGVHRAVYVGDLRSSRGLRTMLDAVAGAPGWVLDLVGPVAPGERDWLAARMAADDVADRVVLHGRLAPADAWAVGRRADVGFVLLEDTPAFREALPSKVGEYMAAGLAVLATPLPRVVEVLTASGAGAVVVDAAAAAEVLRAWAADPDALEGHRRAALTASGAAAGRTPYGELAEDLRRLAGRGVRTGPAGP